MKNKYPLVCTTLLASSLLLSACSDSTDESKKEAAYKDAGESVEQAQESATPTQEKVDSIAEKLQSEASDKGLQMADKIKQSDKMIKGKGTVVYNEFEGGFYGIVLADGRKLLPMNLATEMRQDGLPVELSGHLVTDMMTTRQWGTPFNISTIEAIGEATGNRAEM